MMMKWYHPQKVPIARYRAILAILVGVDGRMDTGSLGIFPGDPTWKGKRNGKPEDERGTDHGNGNSCIR